MALSAGTRQAVGMATGWLVVACGAAVSLIYFSEIQSVARVVLGLRVHEPRAERQLEPARSVARGRTVEIRAGAYGHYFASVEITVGPSTCSRSRASISQLR
jgi:hypothetical protein